MSFEENWTLPRFAACFGGLLGLSKGGFCGTGDKMLCRDYINNGEGGERLYRSHIHLWCVHYPLQKTVFCLAVCTTTRHVTPVPFENQVMTMMFMKREKSTKPLSLRSTILRNTATTPHWDSGFPYRLKAITMPTTHRPILKCTRKRSSKGNNRKNGRFHYCSCTSNKHINDDSASFPLPDESAPALSGPFPSRRCGSPRGGGIPVYRCSYSESDTTLIPVLLRVFHFFLDARSVFELIPVVRRLVYCADGLLCLQGLHQRIQRSCARICILQSTRHSIRHPLLNLLSGKLHDLCLRGLGLGLVQLLDRRIDRTPQLIRIGLLPCVILLGLEQIAKVLHGILLCCCHTVEPLTLRDQIRGYVDKSRLLPYRVQFLLLLPLHLFKHPLCIAFQ